MQYTPSCSERVRPVLVLTAIFSLAALFTGVAAGSIAVTPVQIVEVIAARITGAQAAVPAHIESIVWNLRLPRVLLAWLVGAALAVSGAVMQSLLRNPLASSFTLGVSAGASLGAAFFMMAPALFAGPLASPFSAVLASALSVYSSVLGPLALPLAGFTGSLIAMFIVVRFSSLIDPRLSGTVIILCGMVLSLFASALLTLFSALAREEMTRLLFWQMGSFALKGWTAITILAPLTAAGLILVWIFTRELDILTFGEEEARSLGVAVQPIKKLLIALTSILTGCAIAFAGVIGFLDLVIPHSMRRLTGPAHRLLVPASALAGGGFMVLADLAARILIPTLELPVGAITAIIGAPVFAWIFLASRRGHA